MNRNTNCHETGEALFKLRKVVLSHWEDLVREVITNSKHQPSIILRNHIPDLIDQLINILRQGEVDENELGKSHGFQRAMLTNYSVADLITEFSLLRETLIDYLYPMGNINCAKLVHKFIDILCKHSTIEFFNDVSMKQSLRRQELGSEVREIKANPIIETH